MDKWSRERAGEPDAEEHEDPESDAEEGEDQAPVRSKVLPMLPVVALLGLSAVVFIHFFTTSAPFTPQPIQTVAFETPNKKIKVYVVGAVVHQGVVSLSGENRVEDAIQAAGGFTSKANEAGVNLAAKVQDGEMLRVPSLGEVEVTPSGSLTPGEIVETPDAPPEPPPSDPPPEATGTGGHFQGGPVEETPALTPAPPPLFNNATPEATASATPAGTPDVTATLTPAPPLPSSQRVSLNRATVDQLAEVPGIDEKLASAIVAYRRGPPPRAFTSLDELSKVPGVEAGKVETVIRYLKL